ncbi:MAG: PilZ domain-containing protein [Candidatus Omnitrophota bacterium]
MENKRLWRRLLTEGKGNFLTRDRDLFGSMSVNNYSRKGFRASLNKSVELGSNLLVEVNLPKYNMPLWATGRVVWTKINEQDINDKFEAGIELNEIDLLNIEQVPDESYKDKYLTQTADYAFGLGLYTKMTNGNFFKTSCSMAGVFIIYFLLGSLFTLINPFIAFFYAATIFSYFLFIIFKKRKIIFSDEFNINSLFRKKNLLRIAGMILNNLCCGLYFIIGFAAQKRSDLQNN